LIKEVKLVQGTKQFVASSITSSANLVRGVFLETQTQQLTPGACDVLATDANGKTAKLESALQMSAS
jgi:hypothetical protein